MKSHSLFEILLRGLLALVGGFMLATGILDLIDRYRSLGVTLSIVLGIVLLFAAFCPNGVLRAVPPWIRWAFGALLLLAAGFFIFLFLFGRCETVTASEDAMIILGCRVRGSTPSKSLARRLDRAIAYHHDNPTAMLVVSGGKGDDEDCSEADAMRTYLLAHGVSADRILTEDRSASTEDNFRFSKAVLDAHFDRPYTVAFLSNDYHILRASRLAHDEGFDTITHAAAPTPLRAVFTSGLREVCALAAYWLGL